MKIKISKIQAAEAQLNEAIFLFFDEANPVVIETLIGAVIGILRPIGKKYGIQAPSHDSDKIKPEYKKLWIDTLHKAQNFFKHADNDSDDILSYENDILPFCIVEACHLFRYVASDKCLKYRQSQPALLFEIWFWLKYPHLLKDLAETEKFLQAVGMPKSFSVDDFEVLKMLADKYRIKL
ncbi:MAG: hypothetical protein WC592_02630 [Candidatus Omnitrophota bacterium]